MEKCVSKVTIDETGVYCPFHICRKNGQDVMKFTYHNPIIVHLMIQGETPRSKEKERYNWKLTGKSLAKWRELTDTQPGPVGSNISLPTDYDKFELVLNKLMSKCFIKSKINKQKESSPRIDKPIVKTIMQFGKKGKRERKISRLYEERCIKENAKEVADKRLERIKKVILTMTEERFSAQGFWKLKKANNAPEQMWSAIIKESVVEVYGEMDVKDAYREEFMNRLQMTKMDPRLTKYQERTESLYKLYIATADQENCCKVR